MARVIPPLTGASPTITPAMLTATNVPETAPAAYAGGTTYALGDTVSVSAAGNAFDVYESLQAGNTGHTPASSPTWWRLLGRTYGVYSGATAYVTGDRVIETANHLEYLALANSTGVPLTGAPASESTWQLQGPTNRWRAFDLIRNTGATGPSPMSFTITPGERVDAVGLAGIVADDFTITVKVGGVTKWTYTESLSTRVVLNWFDYFYAPFTFRSVSAVFDIPKYSGAEVTITFTRAGGDITVGSLWVGNAVDIGELEVEPNLGRRNFSRFDEADDGTLTLIQKRTKPEQSWVLYAPKTQLPRISPLIELLNAVPGMWVGLDDPTDEYFEPTIVVGVYTRFDITPSHPDVRIDLTVLEA